MPTAVIAIATGEFMHTGAVPDGVTHALVTVATNPDPRTQKWNGSTVVAKTAPEIATYDDAKAEADAVAQLDPQRVLNAIVWAIVDTYSAPATVTKFNAARTKILSAYKNRPWLG